MRSDRALIASLRIYYQPIVRLADLCPAYVEILTRAEAGDGTVGSDAVIHAMSGADRSMRITSSIMRATLAEYKAFHFGGFGLSIAFNLPLDAMLHPRLMARIEIVRAQTGLGARNIRFELTEQQPVRDLEAAGAAITRLRHAGYGLALDDITPETPHLPELMALPIRAVKLDKSVVVSSATGDETFIREIVARARVNGQAVIAEGIETAELCERMRRLGVTHGQGFLFAHPLSAGDLRKFLVKHSGETLESAGL
jgi:EAL domain-containing protein (putative c-di-GMP-specific phosphodiesterase class I)